MAQEEIILISDPRILNVSIKECDEKLISLLDCKEILVDRRKEKHSDSFYRVRETILQKLLEAQKRLSAGIRLLVIEGHRPIFLQREYFQDYSAELLKLHPEWDERRIYQEASKYVAPPEIIPPHLTGGAVDLTLATDIGKELDMGTRVNADPEESNNACFTLAENITAEAKANRDSLIDAMSKSDFVNYPTEWWHWSYGDRYWAYHNSTNAIYGSTE